jgi:hypothetical protein
MSRPAHTGMPLAQCDRCGFTFHLSELSKEWTNLLVCASCFENRHPQEFLKGKEDKQTLPNMRHVTTSEEATFVEKTFPPDTSHL